jgi:hypothetical protein
VADRAHFVARSFDSKRIIIPRPAGHDGRGIGCACIPTS